ncbi:PEP/pyruvate-binding domain-containing protein [Blastococcus deserti]|uniref:PEP/pyruvate-binding domain-containing protein n=1 Tax=Blastococcus deserti TaxID=2259033 RepID=A0ABW4X9Y3_9ACTN
MWSPSADVETPRGGGLRVAPRAGAAGEPVPLEEAQDAGRYGEKAVQLGVARRAGLPVPAGVALPASLVEAVASGDRSARRRVERARAELGTGPVAVRSSAIGEDSTDASFAGQHVTVLNADDVVAAVEQVVASTREGAVAAYRGRLGQPGSSGVGVVVQRLVPARVAGVLFTCDPVTGADELVVEASWALGEAVVGGMVTPDLYRLSPDGELRGTWPGRKDRAVVAVPGGGTRTVAVPTTEALRPALDARALDRLAALARRVREVWSGHSDLEWAFSAPDDGLALLQRRPVTAAPTVAGRTP